MCIYHIVISDSVQYICILLIRPVAQAGSANCIERLREVNLISVFNRTHLHVYWIRFTREKGRGKGGGITALGCTMNYKQRLPDMVQSAVRRYDIRAWAENLAEFFLLLSFLYISQKSFDRVKNWIEQHNEQQVMEDRKENVKSGRVRKRGRERVRE